MESLLLDAVEEVTKYLTPQELSACCAVSVDWRDAFNQDSLWRPHCNKDTAEYLETAECRVEPRFESPESEHSTLSPVCRWRMCYMREIHLRNNWRQWNYVKEIIKIDWEIESDFNSFVSNDFVIISNKQEVTLWNVKDSPVRMGNPFRPLCDTTVYCCYTIGKNTIALVLSSHVEVYSFDSVHDETWRLKYFFFIDDLESRPPNEADTFKAKGNEQGHTFTTNFIIESFFICFITKGTKSFKIWDLSVGKLLKWRGFPKRPEKIAFKEVSYSIIEPEKQSSHFVAKVRYDMENIYRYYFYIYSLREMKFISFEVCCEFQSSNVPCVLVDRFLAITNYESVLIYNYVKQQLVVKVPTNHSEIMAVGSNILITDNEYIYGMFNSRTLKVEMLTVTNDEEVPILFCGEHLFGGFFSTANSVTGLEFWATGKCLNSKEITCIGRFCYVQSYDTNKSHTKIILNSYTPSSNPSYFEVISFW
ncbi:uncharacterized protein LOC124355384 [Homalodisca vitripennis]|uniref:uncharacterized protein LOC124355384 n=1 Tax=Homalodisca vitripennis TaxID=197043 RepID=UPI001EEC28D1|nr:uncharacterized protein LOC124355384 [Homalodisca vitripennis]